MIDKRERRWANGADWVTDETGTLTDAFASTAVTFMKRSNAIVNVHTRGHDSDTMTLHSKTNLLESAVADASANVSIDGHTCVSLPSIGLQGELEIDRNEQTADSQLGTPQSTEGVPSLFRVHRTPKLPRLDVPQSR